MLVYTFDNEIKDKLLNDRQTLIKEQLFKGKAVYIFKINNLSLLKTNFSHEENKKIFIYDNKMTF